MQKEFLIPEQNLESLKNRFQRYSKKAARANVPAPILHVGVALNERMKTPEGQEYIQRYRKVTVEWNAVTVNEWKLYARLIHLPEGNIIKNFVGEEVPHQYRNASPNCDHCEVNRKRYDTFIIKNLSTGEFRQAGANCMSEYFGISAAQVMVRAELIAAALDSAAAEETLPSLVSDPSIWPLEFYLAHVAEVIGKYGWVPRSKAREMGVRATADTAFDSMFKPLSGEYRAPSEASLKEAREAVEWAENLPEDSSEYLHNLRTIAIGGAVESRIIGYAASILPTFRNERNSSKFSQESDFVGQIGGKVDLNLTVEKISDIETTWGEISIHILRDSVGNVLIWKTGNRLDEGKTYRIRAKVKDHQEYRGTKQTVLSYCKVVTT